MGESLAGKYVLKRRVVSGVLDYFGSRHGLKNPSGRVIMEETPLLVLPSDMTKPSIYNENMDLYKYMMTAVSGPSRKPRSLSSIFSYSLNFEIKITHIYEPGKLAQISVTCFNLWQDLKATSETNIRHYVFWKFLGDHRLDAQKKHEEHGLNNNTRTTAAIIFGASVQHFILTFLKRRSFRSLCGNRDNSILLLVSSLTFLVFMISMRKMVTFLD